MGRVIAISNQKGGVAKSTTAEAFAAALTQRGFKVLSIDMDAQPGNLSLHVGAEKDWHGTLDVFLIKHPSFEALSPCIQACEPFGDVLSASEDLESYDERLNARVGRERLLDNALADLRRHYDYIIIDTPPSLQIRTINALCAADDVIIPTCADLSSVAGIGAVLDLVDEIRTVAAHDVQVAGIALVNWDSRLVLAKELEKVVELLAADRGVRVFSQHVRHAVAAAQAQRYSMALVDYAPSSTVAEDYGALVDEYLATAKPTL